MAERLGNLGYLSFIKEVAKGTPLAPTSFAPLYKETLATNLNLVEDNPIVGIKFSRYQVLQGQRSHKGDVTVMAEPNTVAQFFDMLLNKTGTSGSGPYTHAFALNASNPNSYTVDISTGNIVARYFGVEASKIVPSFDKNEMRLQISMSALGSFQGREIASVATTIITLKTDYDPAPTTGLVVGDLVRLYTPGTGTTADFSITALSATTVTLSATAAAFVAGAFIYLRPATPTFNLLTPFLWSKTQFKFGATATAALAAAQTRVEQGSMWDISHSFESADGAMRSGGFDPAALVRTQGDVSLKIKKFFDTPDDLIYYNALTKSACVVSHLAGSTNQYELRVTYNHLKTDGKVVPDLDSGNISYSELDYKPQYDATDGQAFDVKVLNALSTI